MDLCFRYAIESDLADIVAIENSSMSAPWSLDSYSEAIDSEHAFILVATVDDDIAGFAVFYLTPPESELPDIVVNDKYRRMGVGRALLHYAFSELKDRSVDKVFLEVRVSNYAARALYDSIGFQQIGIRKYFYSAPIEDAICMSLDIGE